MSRRLQQAYFMSYWIISNLNSYHIKLKGDVMYCFILSSMKYKSVHYKKI